MRNKVISASIKIKSATEANLAIDSSLGLSEAELDGGNYIGNTVMEFNMKTAKMSTSEQDVFIQKLIRYVDGGGKLPQGFALCLENTQIGFWGQELMDYGIPFRAQGIDISTGSENTASTLAENVKAQGAFGTLVGHSETRRAKEMEYQGVANADQKVEDFFIAKMHAALKAGLSVNYCIGENFIPVAGNEKQHDTVAAKAFLYKQLTYILSQLTDEEKAMILAAAKEGKAPLLTIAYEPRFAIGPQGVKPTQEHADEMARLTRAIIIKVLEGEVAKTIPAQYGGSADASNISTIGGSKYWHGALAATAAYKIKGENEFEILQMAENKQKLMEEEKMKNKVVSINTEATANVGETEAYQHILRVGRPPNVQENFPNSQALLVSGQYIDEAMKTKGKATAIAVNGRNRWVIEGAMRAAQRANSALIVEIAKSEGGIKKKYCPIGFLELPAAVDEIGNRLGITVPVAIHADHYGIKNAADIETAKTEIPLMFSKGMTSIAIDASHMSDDENLLANIALNSYIPKYAGYETESGEIKGKEGLSTPAEAKFLIAGLNAHGIHPDWVAVNNGTTHGIEASNAGIQVGLTRSIHDAVAPYDVNGAQHGTSGNNNERLGGIVNETRTTKANVATALQMISWGVQVDAYGNAVLGADKLPVKVVGKGVSEETWAKMMDIARANDWKGGNVKNLNLPIDDMLAAEPVEIQERMIKDVETFVYNLMVNVFNSEGTADVVKSLIIKNNSYQPARNKAVIEDPADWTEEKIREKANLINSDRGPEGNFDD